MSPRKLALRVVKITTLAVVCLFLLFFLTVQAQQWLFRWRAERLMADMHQIRLYQSTWTDAQRLMHRWGAWGHYDGTCTESSCRYRIELGDSISWKISHNGDWLLWLLIHDKLNLFPRFGFRSTAMIVTFTVQDGAIWRQTATFRVDGPIKGWWRDDDNYPLAFIVETKSRQRVRQTLDDWWVMGGDEQLAQHPYYKAGRPGGCEINCELAVVTYSTHTPPAEIERLTSFNFSCLTRFSACATLEEVLPAAQGWHLYHEEELYAIQEQQSKQPKPCDIPVWALARDAHYALAVESVSSGTGKRFAEEVEEARVKIVAVLKGNPPWKAGEIVSAYPFPGMLESPPFEEPEHLLKGRSYIVFPIGDDQKDERLTKDSKIDLLSCGIQEDTPEIRHEVQKGLAMNDNLRVPERW